MRMKIYYSNFAGITRNFDGFRMPTQTTFGSLQF
jgi:hypothetical protein